MSRTLLCSILPAVSDPATLVFDSDFSGDWVARFGKDQYKPLYRGGTTVEQIQVGNETALRVHYKAGTAGSQNGMFFIMPLDLGDGYRAETVLRLKPGFIYNHTGKLIPALKGGLIAAGRPNGTDGFSSRPVWNYLGEATAYVYHMDQQYSFGDAFYFGELTSGVFHTIRHELILNTPGTANGIVRYWLNGNLGFSKSDLRFRTIPTLKIDRAGLETFFGGSQPDEGPLRDEFIDFLHMKIWTLD